MDVAATATTATDHDLNDSIEGTEESSRVGPLASFGESVDPRGRGRQHSYGERILRFDPTISVKYFDTEKKAQRTREADLNRKRVQNIPTPPSLLHDQESKTDNPIIVESIPPEVADV
jgi:hypothetical protein